MIVPSFYIDEIAVANVHYRESMQRVFDNDLTFTIIARSSRHPGMEK